MELQELRIGNLVRAKSPEKREWQEPVKVCIAYLYMHSKDKVNFEPIHLTEDWLVKLGFSYDGFTWVKEYDGIKYIIVRQDDWYFIGVRLDTGTYYFACEIKTLHRLQNVWHSVTGQELEISHA